MLAFLDWLSPLPLHRIALVLSILNAQKESKLAQTSGKTGTYAVMFD
jgi:hypothetical protein